MTKREEEALQGLHGKRAELVTRYWVTWLSYYRARGDEVAAAAASCIAVNEEIIAAGYGKRVPGGIEVADAFPHR
jgi:hypothetical protein